jgi:hypothetical protein
MKAGGLKLVRLPLSLAATVAALPSISEIPFLDSWLRCCAGHRTRGHCALSAMLTVSQLSKSFAGRALFDDVGLAAASKLQSDWSSKVVLT